MNIRRLALHIQLVAKCLKEKLNPFLKDALDQTAHDYAQHFRDVLGHDMRQLIETAMEQWRSQMAAEEFQEMQEEQIEYDPDYFGAFKQA